MSSVTDVILTEFDSVGDPESRCDAMDEINDFMTTQNSEFLKVDEYAGGPKWMQMGIWMAAVNHCCPIDQLAEAIELATWEWPDKVGLFVNGEHYETGFQKVILDIQ